MRIRHLKFSLCYPGLAPLEKVISAYANPLLNSTQHVLVEIDTNVTARSGQCMSPETDSAYRGEPCLTATHARAGLYETVISEVIWSCVLWAHGMRRITSRPRGGDCSSRIRVRDVIV